MPRITPARIGAVIAAAGAIAGTTVGVRDLTSVSRLHMTDVPKAYAAPNAVQLSLVRVGLKYGPASGIRYVWGGSSTRGFDCSGYVQYVHAHSIANVLLPRTSEGMFADRRATSVPRFLERAGDAVFFVGAGGPPPGHVGLYIGNGKFIEYYSSGKPAHVAVLSEFRRGYMGARRWYTPAQVPEPLLPRAIRYARQFHERVIYSFTRKGWVRWAIDYVPRSRAMYRWALGRGIKAALLSDRTRILLKP